MLGMDVTQTNHLSHLPLMQYMLAELVAEPESGRTGERCGHGRGQSPKLADCLGLLHVVHLMRGGLQPCLDRINRKKNEVD